MFIPVCDDLMNQDGFTGMSGIGIMMEGTPGRSSMAEGRRSCTRMYPGTAPEHRRRYEVGYEFNERESAGCLQGAFGCDQAAQ